MSVYEEKQLLLTNYTNRHFALTFQLSHLKLQVQLKQKGLINLNLVQKPKTNVLHICNSVFKGMPSLCKLCFVFLQV